MNVFFGKIKPTPDNKQIKGHYYETLSPMKLGEVRQGDYAFIISGSNVHLWRATEQLDIDGGVRMDFEPILSDLPLSALKLAAFKYFKLVSSLIVLTIRQSPKAFYQIPLIGNLTEEQLKDRSMYEDENNFRRISIFPSQSIVDAKSSDIQLYFKDDQLHIQPAPFWDAELIPHFTDNLDKMGKGRREKDKALQKVSVGLDGAVTYSYSELPIMRMYDALFIPYGDKDVVPPDMDGDDETAPLIEEEDSLELDSFNQIYYGPPGTGKTYQVLRSFCVEEETTFTKDQQRIKLNMDANFWHLAPGRGGYLWNELKKGDVLGYEWSHKDWNDLRKLTPKEVEEEDEGGSFQLITYLREVKKGDYICVISGRKLLGIAEVTEGYNYETAIKNPFKFQTVPVRWLMQFKQPPYLNASQTKTFVRLNHGKRWNSLLTILRENGFFFNDDEVKENKIVKPKNYTFITFHQSFSYEDFIQGIKPVLPESDEEGASGELQYEMVPGVFYQACDKAARLAGYKDLQDCLSDNKRNRQRRFKTGKVLEYYLIIDEFNRGNVAAIFGELITLIEDDKRLGGESEIVLELPYSKTPFGVPLNLRIIGTMNTADRSIEALDVAFRRRFSFEEVLPNPEKLLEELADLDINPRLMLTTINERIEKLRSPDHTIGHAYFMNLEKVDDLRRAFAAKLIPQLQEYFYGDASKVGLILGEDFLDIKVSKATFKKIKNIDAYDLEDKTIYRLKRLETMKDEDFIQAVKAIYAN